MQKITLLIILIFCSYSSKAVETPSSNDTLKIEINDTTISISTLAAYEQENVRIQQELTEAINRLNEHFDKDQLPKQEQNITFFAICFIVPCVTLIAILIILAMFVTHRNYARNALIEKAIAANYTLPESFFNSQFSPANSSSGVTNVDTSNKQSSVNRNPKTFTRAIKLLAVGLSIILFFLFNHMYSIAFLAGGIPFLIGVGQLIGYLYIPGYCTSSPNQYPYSNPSSPHNFYTDNARRSTPPPTPPHIRKTRL